MTLPERLYACPAAFDSSPLRATARYAGVRFNFDGAPHYMRSTVWDQRRFTSEDRSRCTRAHRFRSSRNPAGYLALIEFP